MASMYDAYWQDKLDAVLNCLNNARASQQAETLDVSDIGPLSDRKSWFGRLEIADCQSVYDYGSHMASLGQVLIPRLPHWAKQLVWSFTLTKELTLLVQQVVPWATNWFETAYRNAKLAETVNLAVTRLGPIVSTATEPIYVRSRDNIPVLIMFCTKQDGWFSPRVSRIDQLNAEGGQLVFSFTDETAATISLWQVPIAELVARIQTKGYRPSLDRGKAYSFNILSGEETDLIKQLDWDIRPLRLAFEATELTRATFMPPAPQGSHPLPAGASVASSIDVVERLAQWVEEATDSQHPNNYHANLDEAAQRYTTISTLLAKLRNAPESFSEGDALSLFGTLNSGQRTKRRLVDQNIIGDLRQQVLTLLYGEGSPWARIEAATAAIRFAGTRMLGELYGWAHADTAPLYNSCATEALAHLGYRFNPEDYNAFVAAHEQFKQVYQEHVGHLHPDLPLNLEIDKFYNVIDKVDLKQSPPQASKRYWRITLPDDWKRRLPDGSVETVDVWEHCLQHGIAAIGVDDILEVSQEKKFISIQPGDQVVGFLRHKTIGGVGTVTRSFDDALSEERPADQDYWHDSMRLRIGVDWDPVTISTDDLPKAVANKFLVSSVLELSESDFQAVLAVIRANQVDAQPALASSAIAREFHGFSPEAFRFLSEIEANNTKEWMHANLDRYEQYVREPFRALLNDVGIALAAVCNPYLQPDALETEPKFGRTLATVKKRWPDVQGPYHNYFWGAFYRQGLTKQIDAQLFVIMYPNMVRVGFYVGQRAKPVRDQFRRRVLADPGGFFNLANELGFLADFEFVREHADGKRELIPVESPEHLATWLETGDFDLLRRFTPGDRLVHSSTFADTVYETLRRVFPVYLWAVAEDPSTAIDRYLADQFPAGEEIEEIEPLLLAPVPYTRQDFLTRTYLEEPQADDLNDMLLDKRQIVLYGPPGTGKTYVAQELAKLITGLAAPPVERVEMIQFHPAYSYEDFIEGIRPESKPTAEGYFVVDYPSRPGVFRRFCLNAQQLPDQPHVFVIDEINRGNIARIFGELMLLLEYRDRDVPLPYSGKRFRIPPNVYLIGTMNTADRSIALVDFALRRRFHFFHFSADPELFERWLEANPIDIAYLAELYRRLSQEAVDDPDYAVGPSYFMDCKLTEPKLERIWRRSIEPYLAEYYIDQRAKLSRWRWDSDFMKDLRAKS